MAFSSGTFSLVAGNPVVTNTTISSTWANNTLNDIATGLTTCVLKDGTQTLTAAIPLTMGATVPTGQALTGSGTAAITGFAITAPTSASGTVHSGTYTPTLTNGTNVAASTTRQASYLRVGNTVTVAGQIDVDPTTTGTTLISISLPVASDLTTTYQLAGVAFSFGGAAAAQIQGDATNNRADCYLTASSTANQSMTYIFSYQVA